MVFAGIPSPSGRGRRGAAGEGRKAMQILRPSPCPLPEGEGESSSTSIHSHVLRGGECPLATQHYFKFSLNSLIAFVRPTCNRSPSDNGVSSNQFDASSI